MSRLSVSQFVILPPYSRRGHGTKLLRTVYKEARGDDGVLDVTVESPNEAFLAMRLGADAAEVREAGLIEGIKGPEPPWAEVHNKTKLSMVQIFALAESIGCEAGRAGVRRAMDEEGDAGNTDVGKEERDKNEREKEKETEKKRKEEEERQRVKEEEGTRRKKEEEEMLAKEEKERRKVEDEDEKDDAREKEKEKEKERENEREKEKEKERRENERKEKEKKDKAAADKKGSKTKAYPTLFGVQVDLEYVYEKSQVLGFTRAEIDDIMHGIRAEDLEVSLDPVLTRKCGLRARVFDQVGIDFEEGEPVSRPIRQQLCTGRGLMI